MGRAPYSDEFMLLLSLLLFLRLYVGVDKYDTIDRAVEAIRSRLGVGPHVMLRLMEVAKLSCTPCSLDEMCSILPPTSYEKTNVSSSDILVEEVTKVMYKILGCYVGQHLKNIYRIFHE